VREVEDDNLMTSKELAEFLRTTERFVRRLVSEKRIEYIKAGRAVRFPRRAVLEYLDRNRVRPMSRAEIRRQLREVS
jgi:excisionase family DNA binding protein